MNQDLFKIYLDRLGDGDTEQINEEFAPGFMDIHEKEIVRFS